MNSIPPITKNLLIINLLCFVAAWVLPSRNIDLENLMSLHFFLASDFMPHQLLTYLFMHGSVTHLFFNMFALWMFGGLIERTLGYKRFLIYYFVCGIGAGICQEVSQYIHYSMLEHADTALHNGILVTGQFVIMDNSAVDINLWSCVGASGAIYGILLAFGMYYPNEHMFIFPLPVPIKAKYMVMGYTVIEVMSILTGAQDKVAHMAHLGGMLFGLLLILWWRHTDRHNQRGNGQYVSFDYYNRRY